MAIRGLKIRAMASGVAKRREITVEFTVPDTYSVLLRRLEDGAEVVGVTKQLTGAAVATGKVGVLHAVAYVGLTDTPKGGSAIPGMAGCVLAVASADGRRSWRHIEASQAGTYRIVLQNSGGDEAAGPSWTLPQAALDAGNTGLLSLRMAFGLGNPTPVEEI